MRQNGRRITEYWCDVLGLTTFPTPPGLETEFPSVLVGFSEDQAMLQLIQVDDGAAVDHAKSSGRIAFACNSVRPIFEHVTSTGDVVQTPPLTLPTPGKADVVVTILRDRDGYEICFVEDEAFYELATPTYDVIDFVERAQRGGDGHPPPKAAPLEHAGEVMPIDGAEAYNAALSDQNHLIVLDFGASWCKNCRRLVPFVGRLANELAGKAKFFSVNIEVRQLLAYT
jgi:thiol-disulfide isomerase/thioredoxin